MSAPRAEGIVDTHCHLASERYDADRAETLARAWAAGIERIVVIGDSVAGSRSALELARTDARLFATAGIHPHEADAKDAASLAALAELARDPKVVAIGEIGLDYHYDFADRGLQRELFAEQLQLADRVGLPVVIHNRETDADMQQIIGRVGAPRRGGVFHCFWSDAAMAEWAIAQGFYLGVGGAITFGSAGDLRAVIAAQPLERLIVETDGPYLAPAPHRGKRNEPAFTALVVKRLAELFARSEAEIAACTTANAERLFGFGLDSRERMG